MAYVNIDDLRGEVQSGAVSSAALDAIYSAVINAVDAAVDQFCGRTFVVPTSATARTYRPTNNLTEVFDLDDIASTTGLAVAVDTNASGTYTTLATTDYVVETDNQSGMVECIRSVSTFPYSAVRPRSIQVTARYGWPETPADVKRAAMIWCSRLVNRRQSPTGVMGFGDLGAIRISTMDPDVQALLGPYRLRGRLLR